MGLLPCQLASAETHPLMETVAPTPAAPIKACGPGVFTPALFSAKGSAKPGKQSLPGKGQKIASLIAEIRGLRII